MPQQQKIGATCIIIKNSRSRTSKTINVIDCDSIRVSIKENGQEITIFEGKDYLPPTQNCVSDVPCNCERCNKRSSSKRPT